LDLDIGLDTEVLHAPVLALEPECIAGLGDLVAVDEFVAAVDADDTAPGAHADDRADPLSLDAGVDDVAVGAGDLIGHEGHWPARCVLRIGDHPVVAAGGVPADDPIGEALGHERTRVPTPIEPDIGDDAFAAHRLTQVAVQLSPPRGGHIGNVDVADASLRLLGHVLPP